MMFLARTKLGRQPTTNPLFEALAARGPHPSLGAHAETYGRIIGSWVGEIQNHTVAPARVGSIEVHFGWALDGRAVQDVWITPAREDRGGAGCNVSPAPRTQAAARTRST